MEFTEIVREDCKIFRNSGFNPAFQDILNVFDIFLFVLKSKIWPFTNSNRSNKIFRKFNLQNEKLPHGGMAECNLERSFIHVFFIKFCLPPKIVFHLKYFPFKVVFVKSRLPSKVVFHQRSYSIKGRLTSKAFFHKRLSSI